MFSDAYHPGPHVFVHPDILQTLDVSDFPCSKAAGSHDNIWDCVFFEPAPMKISDSIPHKALMP
jgi:hypothetical protein